MFIRVSGAEFQSRISRLIPYSGRTLLNFKVIGDVLSVQVISNLICETELKIIEKSGTDGDDITVSASQALLLVDTDSSVDIEIQKEVIIIAQKDFNFQATREWEQRSILPTWDEGDAKPFDEKEFSRIMSNVKALDALSKATKEPQSNVVFSKGYAYIVYYRAVLVQDTSIGDFTLTAETARNLLRVLDVNCEYVVNKDRNYILIKTKYKIIHFNVLPNDVRLCESIGVRMSECKKISTVSLSYLSSKIDVLQRVYRDGKVQLSITENGLRLQVTDGKVTLAYGSTAPIKVTMQSTVITLTAINKILNSVSNIEAYTGGNILCLQFQGTKLLLSGTLF